VDVHPLVAAAAEVLGFDAPALASAVASAPPAPDRRGRGVEARVRAYYETRALPEGFSLYSREDVHPAVAWCAAPGVVAVEDAAIVNAPAALRPSVEIAHAARCVRRLIDSGAGLWNDEILRLCDFAFVNGTARARFARGRFFDYRFTTGLLGEEAYWDDWPLREQLMPAMTNYGARFTGGGLQAMVAIARGAPHHDFAIPLQVRSRRVSDGQGLYGVVPMAYHQPMVHAGEPDARGLSTALREIAEELGGMDEKDAAEFATHPAIAELRQQAVQEITGFSLNLVNGNYDYNILICHPDPRFWEDHARHWTSSWEAERVFMLSSRDGGTFHRMVRQEAWVPQSVPSLYAGFDRLRAIDPKRVG